MLLGGTPVEVRIRGCMKEVRILGCTEEVQENLRLNDDTKKVLAG